MENISNVKAPNKTKFIYWEKQNKYMQMCAVHCLNCLLQGPFFTPSSLSSIAKKLDKLQKDLLGFEMEEINNSDKSGNYNVQVIEEALKKMNITITPLKKNECQELLIKEPNKVNAIIFNSSTHWFAIRKIDNVWYNLNSSNKFPGPQIISDFYMDAFIKGTEEYGFTNFLVSNIPPINFDKEVYYYLNKKTQFLVPIEDIQKDALSHRKINISEEDEEEYEKVIELSKKDFQFKGGETNEQKDNANNNVNEYEMDDIERIMQQSKMDYLKEIQKILPEEPKESEEYFKIIIKGNNGKEFYRRFSPWNSVDDVKNFAKIKLEKNEDINLFVENDGTFLFDPNCLIKDANIEKEVLLVVRNYDEDF